LEKFNQLLDETTILNFQLLAKLANRYRIHLSVCLVSFLSLFLFKYYSQPIIFSVSVPFKVVAKHTVSTDFTTLMPTENTSSVTISELSVAFSSYSFVKSLASSIAQDPDFEKLNFGTLAKGNKNTGATIKANCKLVPDCVVDNLTAVLGGFYSVEQGLTESRYVLNVSATDAFTVQHFVFHLTKMIDRNRIESKQYLLTKEIDSITKLMTESRMYLKKMNGFEVLDENERTSLSIHDLKERMRNIQANINSEHSNIALLEAKAAQNKFSVNRMVASDRAAKINTKVFQTKIDEIRQNISSILIVPENLRTPTDRAILSEMQVQLKALEKKFPPDNIYRDIELDDAFAETQRGVVRTLEFELGVARSRKKKMEESYEISKIELERLQKNKMETDNLINKLKADLEFLKNLESKQMSLKLLSSTMTSDLAFEDFSKGVSEYRRSSVGKIFLFSFITMFAIYFLSLVLRFLIDDRIYSEDDLKSHFGKLDFLGEIPRFE